ncbi:MAG: FeoA family protein [Candidatus Kapabacteria bacterium]|nr:FeoA family protein [Candidatus Kapabacteria bacterium]
MTLSEAQTKTNLKITYIESDDDIRRKLLSMGIHINELLIKVNDNKFGPVLVLNPLYGLTKLALDRELAEKIQVEYEN